jgi:hypothetical protein
VTVSPFHTCIIFVVGKPSRYRLGKRDGEWEREIQWIVNEWKTEWERDNESDIEIMNERERENEWEREWKRERMNERENEWER